MIHREMVMLQFRRYVKRFDQNEDAVQLKYAHSLRVSALCEEIADSLGLSAADRDLAWLLRVLHDIGRFEQLRTYHTFVDYRSMDHAKYGVKYLFDEGHITDFLADRKDDAVICMAISQHNVYELRNDLTPRQRLFCQMIRDADKLDIFRVYVMYIQQGKDIWHTDMSDMKTQSISPVVMEQARQKKLVRTQDKKKYIDFYVGALCLYFDLNYPRSRQLAWQQGYYSKLLSFHSENPASERALHEIRQLVHSTI